jgi:hypothetical protein
MISNPSLDDAVEHAAFYVLFASTKSSKTKLTRQMSIEEIFGTEYYISELDS